jgi:hypothetical protein
MHGFINSPALAKLVALEMVDEGLQPSRRRRRGRVSLRARLVARRTSAAATPAKTQRQSSTGKTSLVEEAR